MKGLLIAILVVSLFSFVKADDGDTTIIRVHDAVDMTYFGNYDRMGYFPDGSESYNKILLRYTMGCASSGCSDWDYTSQIRLQKATGVVDSSIDGYDTISMNPLIIDTFWKVFQIYESFELGRAITPYGGFMATGQNGFNNNWEREFYYDVTDFTNLLKDSVLIRAHYSGWSSGFSVTTDFILIEGTPPREVISIENVYAGSWGYQNSSDFETNVLPPKNFDFQNGNEYKLRVTPSGHGFENNTGCAEFCERNYFIKINGAVVYQQNMWRDDCGLNAVYPQGGTWVYNRANWCPGDYVWTYEHELTHLVSGLSPNAQLDMDIEPIVWSGNQAPSYILDVQLVTYGSFNYHYDLGLEQIIAPSSQYEFNRSNPICGQPTVKVKNYGKRDIDRFYVEYWVEGGSKCYYEWSGLLKTGESEVIELGSFDWNGFTQNTFYAKVKFPNGEEDQQQLNDILSSEFDLPDVLDSIFVLRSWTNNIPLENSIIITDENGNAVFEKQFTVNNALHWDTISLSKGCYQLRYLDYDSAIGGGDGIYWWAAPDDGGGSFQIREYINSTSNSSIIQSYNPDFGSEIFKAFTVGYSLGVNGPLKQPCVEPLLNGIEDAEQGGAPLFIYPNPTNDKLFVDWNNPMECELSIYDLNGKLLEKTSLKGKEHHVFHLEHYVPQLYLVKAVSGDEIFTKKFLLGK